MKPSSEKRLQQLHPALGAALRGVVDDLAAKGIVIEIVQGLRTFAEQDALYAQGRTKPGQIVTQARGGESNHNYGLAADLCPFTNDKPDWNAPMTVWAAIGEAAAARGLDWGGAWKKFLDKPHVELPKMTVKECLTCFESGGMESVWAIASTRVGWEGEATPAPAARGLKMAGARGRRASHSRPVKARGKGQGARVKAQRRVKSIRGKRRTQSKKR